MGRKLSVGAPFFNMAFTPFMVVLAILLPLGSIMPWKRAQLARSFKPLVPAFVLSVAIMGLAYAMQTGRSLFGPIGMFLGTWLIFGAAVDLWQRAGRKDKLSRLRRLPRAIPRGPGSRAES